jgi:glycosyltransferase involved in cell wall biosynthesis
MRIGQNPARQGTPAYLPQRVGIGTLVYIPHLEGYFSQALEIVRIQVESLKAHTSEAFDLFVFDNGSHLQVQQQLLKWQQEGMVDWLFLSHPNLGKTGALNWILGAMPNEIICYTDSDVYFRQGWLQESLKVLEAAPQVGVVSGQPCFSDVLNRQGKSYLRLVDPARIEEYWPETRIIQEHARGLGGGEERILRYSRQPLQVMGFGDQGVRAVLGASHMQFIIRRELARQVIPLPSRAGLSPEEDRAFNQRVDEAGYLHCSLLEPYVVHMGNRIDDSLAAEIRSDPEMGAVDAAPHSALVQSEKQTKSKFAILRRLAQLKWTRQWMTRLYNALFKVLSES